MSEVLIAAIAGMFLFFLVVFGIIAVVDFFVSLIRASL